MDIKQIIKVLEPFALLADALETDGPEWICKGCKQKCYRNTCPRCSPLRNTDVLIDVGGTAVRRGVWLSDLKKARKAYQLLKKKLEKLKKEGDDGKGK